MRSHIRLLSLVSRATVILLAMGAFLVVLGIFDDLLDWDIFSPATERFLYGIFGSCIALGGFGAAISVVLGIQEVVGSFRRLVDQARPGTAEPVTEVSRRRYVAILAGLLAVLVLTVVGFGALNRRVEARRLEVFKLIAQDQMKQLGPRLAAEIRKIPVPCETCAPPALHEIFRTLDRLSFFADVQLYMADPSDEAVLWRYPVAPEAKAPVLERFFIARDDDRAVKLALSGDPAWIRQKNGGPGFTWYHVISDSQRRPCAVIQIDGNPRESFREYEATAEAARQMSQ